MKHLKFALLTATALASIPMANANRGAEKNFYVGIHGGFSLSPNKFTNTLIITEPGIEQNTTRKASKKSSGGVGEVTMGIQYMENTWMSGFELAGNIDGHKATQNFEHADNVKLKGSLKKTFGLVPSIVAGRTYSGMKTMLIAKLGMSINRYKLSIEGRDDHKKSSSSKFQIGFAPSIGLEHPFTKHFSGVATLGYEWNRTVKKKLGSPVAGAKATDTLSIKTSAITGKLGLQYKF